jgi:Uma2 family endonuclease
MRLDPMQKPGIDHWTYEDYLRLPDDGPRCEIIEGERHMTPAPWSRHQLVSQRLAFLLMSFLRETELGVLYYAPFDVILADDTVVQPDIVIVARERESKIRERGLFGAPDLAIEILSPSSESRDRVRKLEIYAKHGVREYWIVDPDRDRIEVHVLEGRRLVKKAGHGDGAARSLVVLPGFSAPLDEVFSRA